MVWVSPESDVCSTHLATGNGTQSIIWQINEETYRVKLEESHGRPPGKPGLQVYYGSLHDILSYPCEASALHSTRTVPPIL